MNASTYSSSLRKEKEKEKKYCQNQANSNKVNPKYEPDLALL